MKPRAPSTRQGEVNHTDTLITLSALFTKPSPVGTAAGITNKQE